MSTKKWIAVGVGVAIAATVAGVVWALRQPTSSAASTGAAAGPATGGTAQSPNDPSRGAATSSQDSGDKARDFFASGLTMLEGFGRAAQGGQS